MATDLESGKQEGEVVPVRPSLKITGLHIKGLKSIGSLDLPEDGLGWNGEIPDFVMVGGINGSGKTTLLEFLASSFEYAELFTSKGRDPIQLPPALSAAEARMDFEFSLTGIRYESNRFLIGNQKFLDENSSENWFGLLRSSAVSNPNWVNPIGSPQMNFRLAAQAVKLMAPTREWSCPPCVVYFPSERRTLFNPDAEFNFTGNIEENSEFVYRWQTATDVKAPDQIIKNIYNIRWEDLNAREAGLDLETKGFDAYSQAFDRFFQGRKRLKWTAKGRLVVETKNGDIHDLSELSSGEKQVILFMGELLHRWHPGSLILIDEPELHLHESYQTKLWEALIDWQKERGGQVIVATQSAHLFGLSGLGTRVILSRRSR